MPIEDFEYDLLNENGFGRDARYFAYYAEKFFVMTNMHIEYGGNFNCWKIHVSVDDEGEEGRANLTLAWGIVAEVLMEMDVYSFKIIAARYLPMKNRMAEENGQTVSEGGKQITIYSGIAIEQGKNWQGILQEITNRLAANNIRPSYLPNGDNAIAGSPYFSYRHERGSRLEFSIPAGEADPYTDIVLNLPQAANIQRKQWANVNPDIQIAVAQHHPENEMAVAIVQPQPDPADEDNEGSFCCRCRC